ncbi:5-formyltetrahydrofolate cyclo-ligase [Fulvimarina sp. 2208YS6-2-32]|uniref:5-formyltetrahydrofolate cyclo-ligase n=1 Tax=Fulvimarina uroteuthidis TaxID=3098149 RepID=A0ABU5HXX5_9HYPH|nr:5-formyltetrahydrofolate cyclo-ligase [Fulvimarina sp. 2208YS6-2-32]MDY8107989.1 5-formyltetrahydrofolate cyclo-ligase [Fulvimarina sp. 2208YS6-2-32]
MTDFKEDKKALRLRALALRDKMDEADRIEASLRLAEHGDDYLRDLEPGTIVSGFLPIRSEVDLRPLMMRLADRGARLCVPAILAGNLEFRELKRGAELVSQGFGTVAPGADAAVLDPSLMLVPLSAFDRRGGRIGYGGGFYDRAIQRITEKGIAPRLVGTAFACQEIAAAPMAEHDRHLHAILTEAGVIETGRTAAPVA